MEGRSAVLIRDGQVDRKALKRESLTREELVESFIARASKAFTRCGGASWSQTAHSMSKPSNPRRREAAQRTDGPARCAGPRDRGAARSAGQRVNAHPIAHFVKCSCPVLTSRGRSSMIAFPNGDTPQAASVC